MADDVTAQIAQIEQQERELVLTSFTNDDAWRLGCLLMELATERDLPVAIGVRRGGQRLFHAAREGTSPDNDTWIERKSRVVERFGASSLLVGLRSRARGITFAEHHQLPHQEYTASGGAFPIRVASVGVVGVVVVTGLPQADDHALAVEGVRALLADRAGGAEGPTEG